jgi:hypothetical protein
MTADLELRHKNVTKARSIIEKARLRNPQNPDLWRKAILIEWEHGSKDQVLQKFPFEMKIKLHVNFLRGRLDF